MSDGRGEVLLTIHADVSGFERAVAGCGASSGAFARALRDLARTVTNTRATLVTIGREMAWASKGSGVRTAYRAKTRRRNRR